MRDPQNIDAIQEYVSFLGFIFYDKSPRHIPKEHNISTICPKVGVFVNPNLDEVRFRDQRHVLNYLQLHKTTVEQTQVIKSQLPHLKIIQAFSVNEDFDFDKELKPFLGISDFFLFDAKGKCYGGNGITFRWELLENYKFDTPFFLSGGICLEHISDIKALQHPKLYAIDINSGFEFSPALKDVQSIKTFSNALLK